jgi:hypothetical protein
VLVTVNDGARVDEKALGAMCPRGVAIPKPESVHLLHANPVELEKELVPLLG